MVVGDNMLHPVLMQQWSRGDGDGSRTGPNEFVRIFGPIYLLVLAALWVTALPEYFGAAHGITSDGTPVGSFIYATACFAVVALAVGSVASSHRSRRWHATPHEVPTIERL